MTTKKVFKILIVDDEPEARNLLKSLLQEIYNVEVVGEAGYAEEALYNLVEFYPDLILMDINMPGKTGMDLVHLIRTRNVDVPVVFVSAFKEYAIQSIKNEVYDFLLKPVCRDELKEVIEKYRRKNERYLPRRLAEVLNSIKEDSKIKISSRHSYVLVDPCEIVFCQVNDGYIVLQLSNGKQEIATASLSYLEEMLKNWSFFKLNRSVLINLDYVRKIDKKDDTCLLKNGSQKWEIQSSRRGIIDLLEIIYNYA